MTGESMIRPRFEFDFDRDRVRAERHARRAKRAEQQHADKRAAEQARIDTVVAGVDEELQDYVRQELINRSVIPASMKAAGVALGAGVDRDAGTVSFTGAACRLPGLAWSCRRRTSGGGSPRPAWPPSGCSLWRL